VNVAVRVTPEGVIIVDSKIPVLYADIVAKVKSDGLSTTTGFDLALTSNQIRYRQKENAIFTVVSKRDCALTLTSIEPADYGPERMSHAAAID
jgi:hypothetical protein